MYPNLPPSNDAVVLISKWVNILKNKKASDELSEDEIRQLKADID